MSLWQAVKQGLRRMFLFLTSWALEKHPGKVAGCPVKYALSATRLIPAGLAVVWAWGTVEMISSGLFGRLPGSVGVAWMVMGALLAFALKVTVEVGTAKLANLAQSVIRQFGQAGGSATGFSFSSFSSVGDGQPGEGGGSGGRKLGESELGVAEDGPARPVASGADSDT